MPLVKISAAEHLPAAQVRGLADVVHAALVAHMGVPEADRFQFIARYADDNRIIDPHFPGVSRTRDATLVEVALRSGRTGNQKRAFYAAIAEGAARHLFRADDLMIALMENEAVDWSFGGGIAHYARG
jgi:phenylpyruvate tautomerase PptA (4-oxalocrotonate tautomerase family)